MQDFGSLKLLVALLGPSSPLLGPIWSQNGPQNGPKSGPKNAQKFVQKMDPKITPKMPVLGPKMAPKLGSKRPTLLDGSHLGQPSGARWPQDGPKMAQDAQDAPKMAPRWPKIAPRWPQEAPLEALLGPSWGSKLGSRRLRTCAFRLGEMLFFVFGGRLGEEAKPTETKEPREEAKDGQKEAPRGSRGGLGMRDPFRPEVNGRLTGG